VRNTRVRRDWLQTPVVTYRHRSTGRLVGMMHIGVPAYFEAVAATVADLERAGAVVQFEGVRPPTAEELADATDAELAAVARFDEFVAFVTAISGTLGWVVQRAEEGLPYPDRWTNVDMDVLQLVRLVTPPVIERTLGKSAGTATLLGEHSVETSRALLSLALRLAMSPAPAAAMSLAGGRDGRRDRRALQASVLDGRNEVALAGVKAAGRTDDVVLIWGAAHLPGMGEVLRAWGYHQTSVKWLSVGPVMKVWTVLRTVLRGLADERRRAEETAT